jgi:two-component system response regulator YesN
MELHRLYFDVIKPSMSYTLYYYCLADICSQLVKAGGAEGIGVLTESLTPELMRFSSIEEQYDIMIHFITQFAARPSNQRKNRSAIVMGAVEYINEHYSQELTVPEIAEALYVSHMYLSKVFHSIMGKSVISYIVATRIDKAKTLLEETDTPVYEIAESVGFRDSKHFSKTFKSIVGVSPMEYRRLERGKQQ